MVAVIDTNGIVLTSYDYYPFGMELSSTGPGDRYKYTHQELDEGYYVNLYYYGARFYNAELGRFVSPDPKREYYNPYSYVANNPVIYIDFTGEGLLAAFMAGAGGFIGGALGGPTLVGGAFFAGAGAATGWAIGRWIENGCPIPELNEYYGAPIIPGQAGGQEGWLP